MNNRTFPDVLSHGELPDPLQQSTNPEEIASGSITQLTRVIADGIISQGLANGVIDNDVGNGVSESIVEGIGSGVMANGFWESMISNGGNESVLDGIGVGVRDSGVGVSVSQGMVNGVRANGVSELLSQRIGSSVATNDVSERIPQDMVNGFRANGVSQSVHHGIGDAINANGVREPIPRGIVNGVMDNSVSRANRESVSEVVVDGSSSSFRQAGYESVDRLDKERLLRCFNQEFVEDLGRNCEDAAATIRFWERMQLEDVEKGTRALLMMKETEVKISEKASYILNLRRGNSSIRRRHRIGQLELLRNCEDDVATIRFWERMQHEDVEKGTRA
ncbi:hypothetical protein Tco_0217870 [Tanacetum coccineum]